MSKTKDRSKKPGLLEITQKFIRDVRGSNNFDDFDFLHASCEQQADGVAVTLRSCVRPIIINSQQRTITYEPRSPPNSRSARRLQKLYSSIEMDFELKPYK